MSRSVQADDFSKDKTDKGQKRPQDTEGRHVDRPEVKFIPKYSRKKNRSKPGKRIKEGLAPHLSANPPKNHLTHLLTYSSLYPTRVTEELPQAFRSPKHLIGPTLFFHCPISRFLRGTSLRLLTPARHRTTCCPALTQLGTRSRARATERFQCFGPLRVHAPAEKYHHGGF